MSISLKRVVIGVGLALLSLPISAALAATDTEQQVGASFHITPADLPKPGATPSASDVAVIVARGNHVPVLPNGFRASLIDTLPAPRRIVIGPDGRIYIALQQSGQVVTLTESDGVITGEATVLSGASEAYGIGFIAGGTLIVGAVDRLWSLPPNAGRATAISALGAFGPPQGHITRSVAIDPRTADIYVGVGSMANLETGEPAMKATIQKITAGSNTETTFATGMRNVTAMAFQPGTSDLYAVTMERDTMGDELVPDYFTRVQRGDDFGWPYQYIGGNAQPEYAAEVKSLSPATVPDVLFAAHSAPLDLAFVPDSWPAHYRVGAIVALHGSWNAGTPRGYKLVFVPFANGRPTGSYENFMTGFWIGGAAPAQVWGRPAALAFDKDGSLLVADDAGGTLWRVTPPAQ